MKQFSHSRLQTRFYLIVIISFQLFIGCNKDSSNEDKPTLTLLQKIDQESMKGMLTLTGYPELASKIGYSVNMYKITYKITYKGSKINASGLVCVPVGAGGSFPVMSFQHGTLVSKAEAPSVSFLSQLNIAIAAIAGTGMVVSYPDLIGFGESADFFHPYYIKEANVMASTEMLTAIDGLSATELSGVEVNDSLFLAGYSQGGWITLAIMDNIEHQTNSNWNLIATSCGAGPYNPELVMEYTKQVDQYEHPYYMAYVLLSFIDAGLLPNSLSNYIKEPYASKIPALFDGIKTGSMIDEQLTKVPADLYSTEFYSNYSSSQFYDLRMAFQKNRVDAWKNSTPLLLIHGQDDIYIPSLVTSEIYSSFLESGSDKVQYELLPGMNHNTAAIPAMIYTLNWFNSFRTN